MDEVPTYRWCKPRSPALSAFVESFEYVRNPPPNDRGRERMVPSGAVSMVVTLDDDGFSYFDPPALGDTEHRAAGAVLVGPQQRPSVVSTRPQYGMVAVNFRPGGCVAFTSTPMSALRDTYVPLADLWGIDGALLREQLLEQEAAGGIVDALERVLVSVAERVSRQPTRRLDRPSDRALAIKRAVRELDRGVPVRRVVDTYGTTTKPFLRRFVQTVGVTPKRYSRLRRMQRLLHALPNVGPVDWARVAAEHGFYDQSHLIHDFTELTGGTPSDYHPRGPDEVNHLPC